MTNSDQHPLDLNLDVSVSSRDIEAWEEELSELARQVEVIENRRNLLQERISTARALFALLHQTNATSMRFGTASKSDRADDIPMIDAVLAGVEQAGRITPQDLKEVLLRGPVGHRLETSEKGFYHGIARLTGRGAIVKHNGWLFSKDRYREFSRALSRGEVVDEPAPSSRRSSPLGDEIETFVTSHPGVKSRDIIAHLRDHPEFQSAVQVNSTNAYNVIARLVKRGILSRAEDGGLFPTSGEEE